MVKEPHQFARDLRTLATSAEDVLWQDGWFAEDDAQRSEEIERHGFAIIRFTNHDVMNDLESVLMRIAGAVVPPATSYPHRWPLSHTGEGEKDV